MTALERFRKRVLRRSLFAPRSLGDAVARLGFVQADPIRCPARAQDLILRHRVNHCRAGDLERRYPKLGLEECFLYAYGFCPRSVWRVVHSGTPEPLSEPLPDAHREALAWIRRHGPLHSKELDAHLGEERVRNYWGGTSRKAKMIMDSLHHRGALRIVRRENGIRVYDAADPFVQSMSPEARFGQLMLVTLQALGAMTRSDLMRELGHFKRLLPSAETRRNCLQRLLKTGRVRSDRVDHVDYIDLDGRVGGKSDPECVRILAPFDPVVRNRARFEHFWNWTYRFEAYTPKAKRKLGYYAMPVLWRDQVVGWANAAVQDGRLKVEFGYADGRPNEQAFRSAAEQEVASLAVFLGLEESAGEAVL